jgi:hypothetical protein
MLHNIDYDIEVFHKHTLLQCTSNILQSAIIIWSSSMEEFTEYGSSLGICCQI